MSERLSFPIYKVEQDNFDGRLVTRLSFVRAAQIERIHHGGTTLVEADIMDGGPAGTITAPEGSHLAETEMGETILVLPNTWTFTADEAYQTARTPKQSCGLGYSPSTESAD